MKKHRTELNFNNQPLKEDEVLVLMPFDELFARQNVTNPDSIVTASVQNVRVKAILMAVPKAFATEAKATFNSWAREQNSQCNYRRHRLRQEDGIILEYPDQHPEYDHCPHNTQFAKDDNQPASIDELIDEFEYCPIKGDDSPEDKIIEAENMTEKYQHLRVELEILLKKEPKIAFAMLLTAFGVKGVEFAKKMRMSPEGAYKVRRKIESLVPGRVNGFSELDFSELHASRSRNDDYYMTEARRLLNTLIEMLNAV